MEPIARKLGFPYFQSNQMIDFFSLTWTHKKQNTKISETNGYAHYKPSLKGGAGLNRLIFYG
jgi:hypothetical protein